MLAKRIQLRPCYRKKVTDRLRGLARRLAALLQAQRPFRLKRVLFDNVVLLFNDGKFALGRAYNISELAQTGSNEVDTCR